MNPKSIKVKYLKIIKINSMLLTASRCVSVQMFPCRVVDGPRFCFSVHGALAAALCCGTTAK